MDRVGVGFWVLTDVLLVGQGTRKSKRDYWRQGGLEKMDLWEWSHVDASLCLMLDPLQRGHSTAKWLGRCPSFCPWLPHACAVGL